MGVTPSRPSRATCASPLESGDVNKHSDGVQRESGVIARDNPDIRPRTNYFSFPDVFHFAQKITAILQIVKQKRRRQTRLK